MYGYDVQFLLCLTRVYKRNLCLLSKGRRIWVQDDSIITLYGKRRIHDQNAIQENVKFKIIFRDWFRLIVRYMYTSDIFTFIRSKYTKEEISSILFRTNYSTDRQVWIVSRTYNFKIRYVDSFYSPVETTS